ncbi:hypothetical protein ACGF0K_36975 [Streptomyces sp. NPDC048156]|uniref:hypothetical protein n=1 Tax=Streptomyces sp. NPDC048156 TaxID=3365502 RepID=UPI0037220F79
MRQVQGGDGAGFGTAGGLGHQRGALGVRELVECGEVAEQAGVGEPGGVVGVGVGAQQQAPGCLLHRPAARLRYAVEEFSILDAGSGLDEYAL